MFSPPCRDIEPTAGGSDEPARSGNRRRPIWIGAALVTLLCSPLPGLTQTVTDPFALAQAARPSVVRLIYPGGGATSGCTGVAVGADRVLTAGHCLGASGRGRPDVTQPGAPDNPPALASQDGARHPEAVESGPGPHDIGWLGVAGPLSPLPLGPPPRVGEQLMLLGYRNDMEGVPTLTPCPVLRVDAGLALLGCSVANGLSGAPLLRDGPQGAEVAALTVARTGSGALAVVFDDWAFDLAAGP